MKKLILILLFIIYLSNLCFSQKEPYPFDKWTDVKLTQARNFTHITYMDSTELEILFYCNLVRIDPKLFAKTYLQKYVDSSYFDKNNHFVKSLFSTLNKIKSSSPLFADEAFFEMAKDHAYQMGKLGKAGHDNYNKRMKKFLKVTNIYAGENCDYGTNNGMIAFMDLLIDDGVLSLGHRTNILNSNYNTIGISIQPHTRYTWNCVMEFGDTPAHFVGKQNWFGRLFLKK